MLALMKIRHVRRLLPIAVSCLSFMGAVRVAAQDQTSTGNPPVNALIPNFYYEDLPAARKWYVEKLGLKPLYDAGWVVIVELGKGMQIALVDGAKGELRAVQEKGTMLSIETDALSEWYDRVRQIEGIEWYRSKKAESAAQPGHITEHEDIREFRIVDPGGYLIEFYQWKPAFRPKSD